MDFGFLCGVWFFFFLLYSLLSFIVVHYVRDCSFIVVHYARDCSCVYILYISIKFVYSAHVLFNSTCALYMYVRTCMYFSNIRQF